VAPNIYYMGYANVINFAGVRIAGLSGIYKSNDYYKGHFEMAPYSPSTAHSVYHVRNLEVFRLSQITQPIDIMLTHDWPNGIYNHGNLDYLLRVKPFLADEVRTNTLGSPEYERLLKMLKPKYWFSAHLHVKYSCLYKHDQGQTTKFLSLDKCLPHRKFLQVIEIEGDPAKPKSLALDPEWLCVLKKTDSMLSVQNYMEAPIPLDKKFDISTNDLDEIKEDFQDSFEIPLNFKQTAPAHQQQQSSDGDNEEGASSSSASAINDVYLNEQTTLLCEMLNLRDPIRVLLEKRGKNSLISECTTQLYNNLLDESDHDNDN
jgi:lariat debranching enzyme